MGKNLLLNCEVCVYMCNIAHCCHMSVWFVVVLLFVGSCLSTKVFIAKLPATGGGGSP